MRPVSLDTPTNPDWVQKIVAEDQKDTYLPLPSVQCPTQKEFPVISCWEMDPAEVLQVKEAIEKGISVRIYLQMWTFGDDISPLIMTAMEPMPGPYNTVSNQPEEKV